MQLERWNDYSANKVFSGVGASIFRFIRASVVWAFFGSVTRAARVLLTGSSQRVLFDFGFSTIMIQRSHMMLVIVPLSRR
jgi:hypothetical protein